LELWFQVPDTDTGGATSDTMFKKTTSFWITMSYAKLPHPDFAARPLFLEVQAAAAIPSDLTLTARFCSSR
jgi:hypothetical protein